MRHAVDDLGQTIVMVTHDPVAASHADTVLFLADGRIVDAMAAPIGRPRARPDEGSSGADGSDHDLAHNLWSRKRRLLGNVHRRRARRRLPDGTSILGDTAKAGFGNAYTAANAGTDVVVRSASRLGTAEDRVGAAARRVDCRRRRAGRRSRPTPRRTSRARPSSSAPTAGARRRRPAHPRRQLDRRPGAEPLPPRRGPGAAPGTDDEVVIDRASADDGDLHVGDRRIGAHARAASTGDGGRHRHASATPTASDRSSYVGVRPRRRPSACSPAARTHLVDPASRRRPATTSLADAARRLVGRCLQPDLEAITGAELIGRAAARHRRRLPRPVPDVPARLRRHRRWSSPRSASTTRSRSSSPSARVSRRCCGPSARRAARSSSASPPRHWRSASPRSAIGFGAGIGLAAGLQALMGRSDLALPAAGLVIGTATIVAAAVVGRGARPCSPASARRCGPRVSPRSPRSVTWPSTSRRRRGAGSALGAVVAGGGVAVLVTATVGP